MKTTTIAIMIIGMTLNIASAKEVHRRAILAHPERVEVSRDAKIPPENKAFARQLIGSYLINSELFGVERIEITDTFPTGATTGFFEFNFNIGQSLESIENNGLWIGNKVFFSQSFLGVDDSAGSVLYYFTIKKNRETGSGFVLLNAYDIFGDTVTAGGDLEITKI